MAGLKFQVRVLDDTLRQDNELAVWHEMERIEHSLDEANIELRELIADFRAPVTAHGLVPALRKLLSRFRKESGTETVLQNQSGELVLDGEAEVQILRIVREALNNARKHSQANMVRVLLSQGPHGLLRVMIEDDGTGISPQVDDGAGDQHFGLAIMRERAASIGGNLHIESEPGEGTRVVLEWVPQAEELAALRDASMDAARAAADGDATPTEDDVVAGLREAVARMQRAVRQAAAKLVKWMELHGTQLDLFHAYKTENNIKVRVVGPDVQDVGTFPSLLKEDVKPFFCEFLETFLRKDTSCRTAVGMSHGDLHGGTLLLDVQENVWLIDYATAKTGPGLNDFSKLLCAGLFKIGRASCRERV